jgi:HEPN domain-containing protein
MAHRWVPWLEQAEHDAEVARFLADGLYWSDAVVLAMESVEKAIKALVAGAITYGQMEHFTHGELEDVLDPKHPLRSHDLDRVIGLRKRYLSKDLVARVVALGSDERRLDLRYPRARGQEQAPFRLADAGEARAVMELMDEVLGYVRAEVR